MIFRFFFDRVPKRSARQLAWTEMATGALLPGGGAGGLAIGGWLMHLQGMPVRRILQRSSALFFLTSAVNVAVVAAAGALLATGIANGPHDVLRTGLPILAAVAAVAIVVAVPRVVDGRRDSDHWLSHLAAGIRDAEHTLRRPTWRLGGALGWLGFDIAVLWTVFHAVGDTPPVVALVLAYMLGYLANAIPVPGGIGVLDGGLAAALVIYGASATNAAAAVLVYHAIALWVPGIGGSIAYARLRRRLVGSTESAEVAENVLPIGVERGAVRARQATEGLDLDLPGAQRPGRNGAPAHHREWAEHAIQRDHSQQIVEEELARGPAEEERLERAEQPWLRQLRGGRAGREVDESVLAQLEFRGDRAEPGACFAEG